MASIEPVHQPLRAVALPILLLGLLLAGCAVGAGPRPIPVAQGAPDVIRPSPAVTLRQDPPRATPPSTPAPDALAPPAGATWRTSRGSRAVSVARIQGDRMSLMWMDPSRLHFRFVPGYLIPQGSLATRADKNASTWVPKLVAGFNGGYKLSDHLGGYYYRGHTVASLRAGLASLVIRRDGSMTVGVWGRGLRMTPDTVVVRQNLRPLITGGISQASPNDTASTWGVANGALALANRSALGRLADGSFVFGYGHEVTALQLARTLVRVGVREAIMLDMNVSWPTGFTYIHHGSSVSGMKINPNIVRPPSTYFQRFEKDFIAVEAS